MNTLFRNAPPGAWHAVWLESCACESLESARQSLSRRGLPFSTGVLHRLFERLARRAERARDAWLEGPPCQERSVAGKRVVLQMDGGRLRQRVNRKGRKKANGYRDFDAEWVEPRQLVLYVLDEQTGQMDRAWGKVADAKLAQAEEFIEFLEKYCRKLELNQAREVIVIADGQEWQWRRMLEMLQHLGIEEEKITQVLDMGHALERLAEVSHVPNWPQARRVRFYLKGKELLKKGKIAELYAHCVAEAKGGRSKRMRALSEYFKKHAERMSYANYRACKVPCGSGAVESMIRQVVNMRLKACGKFWKKENAQAVLCGRSWLKSGRFEVLIELMRQDEVDWLEPAQPQHSCALEAIAA